MCRRARQLYFTSTCYYFYYVFTIRSGVTVYIFWQIVLLGIYHAAWCAPCPAARWRHVEP